jgi:dihydrofolate synthase/folylpolyglutamate synthase
MNYQQAEDYIFSYTDYEKAPMPHDPAFYDLRRVEELLTRLGNPHLAARSVHIAGTKGKGSVAAMVASALSVSGYTTGLYTSPHLHIWRERMRVDGDPISEEEFVALVEKLKPEVEAVNRKATYGQLTTFELLTALGFAFFKRKGAEFQVLEVGMGGTFDATNVITPEVGIITSISLDHTEVLGNSLTEVAGEKAGIIKPGSIVVTSPQPDEVARVIEEACLNRGAELIRVGSDVTWRSLGFDSDRQSLQVKGRLNDYKLSIPLLGQYQLENAAVAVAALEVLAEKGFNISKNSIVNGLAKVNWPGRLQILSRHPLLVVDGAHNPDSAQKLKQSLERYFNFDRAILVIGVSCDKDIAGIVSELAPLFGKVIVTRSRHPRAMAPPPIVAEFARHGAEVEVAEDVSIALTLALGMAGARDLVCVAGSLFVVGEAIEQANRQGRLLNKV